MHGTVNMNRVFPFWDLMLGFQGLSVASSVSQSQGAHLRQQLRSVTRRYLDHFLPASPSMGIIANHPVLLSGCEAKPTPRGTALRRTILEVLWSVSVQSPQPPGFNMNVLSWLIPMFVFYSENFLQFKGHAPPPRLASVLMFLLELLRRNSDSDPALLTLCLPPLLRCVMLVNEPQGKVMLVHNKHKRRFLYKV